MVCLLGDIFPEEVSFARCCSHYDPQGGQMDTAEYQHFAWLARSFGRTDYLPLTPADLEALADAGSYVDKYPGTHLFKEGEDSTAAFVIQRGEVELYRTREAGRRVVGRVRPGAVIGDIAMFQSQPYVSSAKAIARVRAFRLERNRLLPLLIEHPVIAMRWLVAGLSQLEATQQRVIRLMHRTVREQVAEVLLDETDEYGEVHLSQSSLADLLGASRQSVNEALASFRTTGAIETGYRVIRVKDPATLEKVAGRTITVPS
jgi:CRP-like cAMP-binding protein